MRIADIPESVCPAIVLLENEEACVYFGPVPGDPSKVRVAYSRLLEAEVEVELAALEAKHSGYVFLARPKFRFDRRVARSDFKRNGHWFWTAIKANAPVYREVLLAAFFINIFALALPFFTMNVYDRVVPNAAFETLWVLAIGVVLIILADAALKMLRGYFLDLASRRVDVTLSARIMEQALGLRLEHRPASVGSFAVNLRSFETLRDFITSATITTLIDLPFALIFFIVIAWIGLAMVVPVLFGVLILVTFAMFMRPRLQALSETTYQAGALRNATLIESLGGLETLKAMGAETIMQRKWEESTRFLAGVGVKLRLSSMSVTTVTAWSQQFVSVMVIITGVYLIASGDLTMGGLIASSMLASRAVAPFGQLAGLITQYHNARISLNSLDELFETPTEHREEGAYLSREGFKGEIEFKNVKFAYPHSEILSLNGVSFKIAAGEHVAILGRVGSGKTTLQKLAMGLYQPTEGEIFIDGIDLRQLEPREYRSAVGYVPQDITLFHGSLRDNLTLAHHGLTDESLLRAVKRAGIDEFINRHPSGFDMPVSERGDSLSGGQKRCISLARAIVHEPTILLFDEPTGSMDQSTERAVIEEMKTFFEGRTALIVTHRNTLLQLVDRIIVVDGGKIVADGPRDNVIAALQQGRVGKAR
jgi:ATP-binding cassette subfamily C protein LapB